MEEQRARELLARERERIERALTRHGEGPLESDENREPGDEDDQDLYQDEYDAGRAQDLHTELSALERAESRLAAGTFGLSVQSGDRIPDARLEARPTAELTIEEQERLERG